MTGVINHVERLFGSSGAFSKNCNNFYCSWMGWQYPPSINATFIKKNYLNTIVNFEKLKIQRVNILSTFRTDVIRSTPSRH